MKFTGAKRVCGPCPLRAQCLRHPDRTPVRQVVFFTGTHRKRESHIERMKRRIDSQERRRLYGRRIAIVKPVFANLRHNKRLGRFTHEGVTRSTKGSGLARTRTGLSGFMQSLVVPISGVA